MNTNKKQFILNLNYINILLLCVALIISFCQRANLKEQNDNLREKNKEYYTEIEQLENDIERLNEEISDLTNTIEELNNISNEDKLQLIEPIKDYDLELYYNLYKEIEKNADIYNYYSQNDIDYLYRCVETECHDCSFQAKVNVANVILNRVDSDRFKNSVYEVITSPNQFAYHRTEIDDSTKLAVEYAIKFEDTTQGALFFHSGNKTDTFNNSQYIFSDDAIHHFY